MPWIILIVIIVLIPFLLVVFVGAPYVPIHKTSLESVFNSIKLSKSATVVDLGSGDGKVLLLAAQKGYSAIGYELNPFLLLISKRRLRKYPNAKVVMKDMWQADVAQADLVFTFLATKYMERLKTQIVSKMKKGSYFASYAFEILDLELLRKTHGVNTYKL